MLLPMRPILMTADPIGGVWQYALELCRQLAESDVNVVLATMGRRLERSERLSVCGLQNVELCESAHKLEWMREPWSDVKAAGQWLLDLESRFRPSVIHLNQYSHGAISWKVPALVVGHSCVYSWFEAVKRAPPGAEWADYVQAVRLGLQGADLVTAPSRSMLASLIKHYGPFVAAEPINNGCSGARFIPGSKQDFIFTAGRLWDEAKNIGILNSVCGKISWPIYAAGESVAPDGTPALVDGPILLGRLDAEMLTQWFSRAAIFILPARYEPFGLSALEAALSGCALVLGDTESLREIWDDAALFVGPEDPEHIRETLVGLIANPSRREDFARRARKRAERFTPDRMARAYLEVYAKLLQAQPSVLFEEMTRAEYRS
ncbi:MAG TPA: glycosyltransferase family 4 protein [Candidatus Binatia bacterium]